MRLALAANDDDFFEGAAGLPKILGLDFALAADGRAWLLEVNATPGLVGRAERDRRVKDAVLDAAWDLPPGPASILRPLDLT